MATDPQTLIDLSKCYDCNGAPGQWQLFKLGLLQQILLANNPMADTSPQALIDAAKCYACQSPGLWQLFELALLQQIASGGSSISQNFAGTGSPEGVVTASPGATYVDTAAHTFWVKETGTGNTGWVEYS